MTILHRNQAESLQKALDRGKSILLLGARQTGKTTLVEQLAYNKFIRLAQPAVRLAYEKDIGSFTREIEQLSDSTSRQPLVIIDEIQKIPALFDSIQDLIDRNIAQFVLTGSSARKLKRQSDVNLLPGRVVLIYMHPLAVNEISPLDNDVKTYLNYGSLPGILNELDAEAREEDLESYVLTYLEEEVRQEALVRQIGEFNRFLELAAAESGYTVNMSKLSKKIGVAISTIENYYQILLDCLIAFRVETFSVNQTRLKVRRAAKYLFFDLGLRRLGAREGINPPEKYLGHLFEQWVGLELYRYIQSYFKRAKLTYWQDYSDREIDWVLDIEGQLILVEVKFTQNPSLKDARHLHYFLENVEPSAKAFIVCQCSSPQKLSEKVVALPWNQVLDIFSLI